MCIRDSFKNENLQYDDLYPGCLEFFNELKKTKATVAYLTARKKEQMYDGTVQVIKDRGLPFNEKLCILKDEDSDDHNYKANWLKSQMNSFDKIFYFENEAKIINFVDKSLPSVDIIFMDTIHSGEGESPTHLPILPGRFI